MTVLARSEIVRRLEPPNEEIFVPGTWDYACIHQASYDLRVANEFLFIGGKPYLRGTPYPEPYIKIEPGEIAMLSTVEALRLPADLIARVGIRFGWTIRGLAPLFGGQINPGYGKGYDNERLYLFVTNLGSQPIIIEPGQAVFVIEFNEVKGYTQVIQNPPSYGDRVSDYIKSLTVSHLGLVVNLQEQINKLDPGKIRELENKIETLERGHRQVFLFGVILMATTLFGAVVASLLAFSLNMR